MEKIDKHYISEIDKQLAAFDATHANSPSQQMEIDKYRRINQLRDIPTAQTAEDDDLWR